METIKTLFLTACDDGDPSATESTRRKASSFDEISGNHKNTHVSLHLCTNKNITSIWILFGQHSYTIMLVVPKLHLDL